MSAISLPFASFSDKVADTAAALPPNFQDTHTALSRDATRAFSAADCAPAAHSAAAAAAGINKPSSMQGGVVKQKRRVGGSAIVETPSGVQTSIAASAALAPEKYLNQHQVEQLRKKTCDKAKEFKQKWDVCTKHIERKLAERDQASAAWRRQREEQEQELDAKRLQDKVYFIQKLIRECDAWQSVFDRHRAHLRKRIASLTLHSRLEGQIAALKNRLKFFDTQCAASDHEVGDFIMQYEAVRANLAEFTASFAAILKVICSK